MDEPVTTRNRHPARMDVGTLRKRWLYMSRKRQKRLCMRCLVEGMMIEKIIKSNLSDEEKISLINEKIAELENKILAHSLKLSAIIRMIKEPLEITVREIK